MVVHSSWLADWQDDWKSGKVLSVSVHLFVWPSVCRFVCMLSLTGNLTVHNNNFQSVPANQIETDVQSCLAFSYSLLFPTLQLKIQHWEGEYLENCCKKNVSYGRRRYEYSTIPPVFCMNEFTPYNKIQTNFRLILACSVLF